MIRELGIRTRQALCLLSECLVFDYYIVNISGHRGCVRDLQGWEKLSSSFDFARLHKTFLLALRTENVFLYHF